MKLTYSQLDRMFTSLGYKHAVRRLPEWRWWIPVGICLAGLLALALTRGL